MRLKCLFCPGYNETFLGRSFSYICYAASVYWYILCIPVNGQNIKHFQICFLLKRCSLVISNATKKVSTLSNVRVICVFFQIVMQLPDHSKNVFLYLCSFLQELLSHSSDNGLDPKTLGMYLILLLTVLIVILNNLLCFSQQMCK